MPVDNAPAADNGVLSAEDIATHKARLSSESETDVRRHRDVAIPRYAPLHPCASQVLESIQFFRKKLSIVADPPSAWASGNGWVNRGTVEPAVDVPPVPTLQ